MCILYGFLLAWSVQQLVISYYRLFSSHKMPQEVTDTILNIEYRKANATALSLLTFIPCLVMQKELKSTIHPTFRTCYNYWRYSSAKVSNYPKRKYNNNNKNNNTRISPTISLLFFHLGFLKGEYLLYSYKEAS